MKLGRALAVLGVLGVAAAALSVDAPRALRVQDRVEALEDETAKLRDRNKRLESTTSDLAERLRALEKRAAEWLPEDARVVALKGGGTERWELATGGAYVQFLKFDGDVPVFTIKNAAGTAEVALRAGESHVAVDDRGSELRVHTSTLHHVRRDRTGEPVEGLFSVTLTIERRD